MVKNVYPWRQVAEDLARKYQFDDCGKIREGCVTLGRFQRTIRTPKRIKGQRFGGVGFVK